jgi:hypothetical protein
MDPLHVTALTRGMRNELAVSALPDAPVVPDPAPRWTRSRATTAGVLHRLADLLAPEPAPARHTLSAGRGSRRSPWDESPCRPSPTA